jgi:hypothetical protein
MKISTTKERIKSMHTETWYTLEYLDAGNEWRKSSYAAVNEGLESLKRKADTLKGSSKVLEYRIVKKTLITEVIGEE